MNWVFVCFIPCRIPGFTKRYDFKKNKSQGILVYSTCSNLYHWFIWVICWVNLLAQGVLVETVSESFSFLELSAPGRGARVSACTAVEGWLPAELYLSHSPSVLKKPLRMCSQNIGFHCLFSWCLSCPFWQYFVGCTNDNTLLWMMIPLWMYWCFQPLKLQEKYSSSGRFQLKGETHFKLA